MKKYSVLLAIVALVLASLACQTIMGGGNDDFTPPNIDSDGGDATQLPESDNDGGDVTIGGESQFPLTGDAFNVVTTSDLATFQTNLSSNEIMDFYRDQLGKQGYSEDTSLTTDFNGIIAMFFTGNGKTIVLSVLPADNGSNSVTLAYQQ
jgi:hypothetical protein